MPACQALNKQLCLLNMEKRKYKKTLRAKQQENTRERIVEATAALHEELGPANTSIKAIAEKAGVQRLTVYRYFPDDFALFEACTGHWFGLHPPPALTDWGNLTDAEERTHSALLAFYRYYREAEAMLTGAYRDVDTVEAMQAPMNQFEAYLDQVHDDLLAAWKARGKCKQQLSLTLRHCLRFSTWRALKNENLSDTRIVGLVMSWVNKST
jgi:AcrR family transcriptional regulator